MRRYAMACTALVAVGSLVALVDCGSTATGTSPDTCNPCVDGGTSSGIAPQGSGHDTNPDGVPYPNPAGGYGRNARAGKVPGSIIQNFKFLGYTNPADQSQGLQTISLADYYDPCQKRHKLLHLTVAAIWCGPCNVETAALVADKAGLASDSIMILQALDDGPTQGMGATTKDLQNWISIHHATFPEMLDPGLHNLNGFFNAAAIPWNADVDVRTMELLTSGVGEEDPTTDFASPLAEVSAAPGYPIPAGLCP